ncbi:MAG: hypothetical protein RL215_998 [Planctomycetota bacterium]
MTRFWFLFVLLLPHVSFAGAEDAPEWRSYEVEGWTVNVSQRLLQDETSATEKALELLARQLQEIVRVVPATAVGELQKVPLWFSTEYPGVQPRAEYHPGAGWLKENGRNPAMAKGVEFTDIRNFEQETRRMPNFTLHELAHAFHDRVLPGGFGNQQLQAAFARAKAAGLYDKVEQRFGDGRSVQTRAYALSNPMEYFAESTEAFFSTNDFFPFNALQLQQHDPQMFDLLHELWGLPSVAEVGQPPAALSDWKHSGMLWILTTAEGVALPAESSVQQFPLLVRLHRDTFDFRQAAANGADVRFANEAGEILPHQVEEWDAAAGTAAIWVRIPEIRGAARQPLRMYWGNPQAVSTSDGAAVFQESNGFRGVWHLQDSVRDAVGAIECTDSGTSSVRGMIGLGRHFEDGQGISGGEEILTLPMGAEEHSTEVWFRPERMNSTLIGWGNEAAQGKVVMQFRSPPHINMDCYFSGANVSGKTRVVPGEWTHVVHTWRRGEARLYVNGVLDSSNQDRGSPLNIRTPARLYLGGWYNHYDFRGDLDEVRVSSVVRSPEWVRLQYENQKSEQLLVGGPVQAGDALTVSADQFVVSENDSVTVTARAGGADKVVWLLRRGDTEEVVAVDRLSYEFRAGRVAAAAGSKEQDSTAVVDPLKAVLIVRASYGGEIRSREVAITIQDDLAEPVFVLQSPAKWDGRTPIDVVPLLQNQADLEAQGVAKLNLKWQIDGVATLHTQDAGRLKLERAQGSGRMKVTAVIDNGGPATRQSVEIEVQEPPGEAAWIVRPLAETELPQDHQFIAREGPDQNGESWGNLAARGRLEQPADTVFLRVFAEDQPYSEEAAKPDANGHYSLVVRLKPGLVRYRCEFGTRMRDQETVLHRAEDLVCGDVFLIIGQSNAVATDFGKENPLTANEWVRTFGATAGDPAGTRLKLWAPAEARSPGGKSEIGFWGMELGRMLVESERLPICLINGAVGGTRIDQHQRNPADPVDVTTIYGRLLWRVREAGLTHGVRAIIWHQGENDQGADGPTGGFGYETYEQDFVSLAADWKRDYPNLQRYYAFQIWPRSCAMGVNGSDNRLRDVQRRLPRLFSNLSVIATLGIKPPGGCHFPAEGYAQFARYLHPLMQQQLYDHPRTTCESPSLQRTYFRGGKRDEIVLEFDQPMQWNESLVGQFSLAGLSQQVQSGAAEGNRVILKLHQPADATTITYADSAYWNPEHLLLGVNGMAALTFCDVTIEAE